MPVRGRGSETGRQQCKAQHQPFNCRSCTHARSASTPQSLLFSPGCSMGAGTGWGTGGSMGAGRGGSAPLGPDPMARFVREPAASQSMPAIPGSARDCSSPGETPSCMGRAAMCSRDQCQHYEPAAAWLPPPTDSHTHHPPTHPSPAHAGQRLTRSIGSFASACRRAPRSPPPAGPAM